jgi:hypothetical protein
LEGDIPRQVTLKIGLFPATFKGVPSHTRQNRRVEQFVMSQKVGLGFACRWICHKKKKTISCKINPSHINVICQGRERSLRHRQGQLVQHDSTGTTKNHGSGSSTNQKLKKSGVK